MPGTSEERGLSNPYDPTKAIPEAAKLLVDLARRFGNVGLAIAAYNAGPGRIANWLDGNRTLPRETEVFVLAVTGRSAAEWARSGKYSHLQAEVQSCTVLRSVLGSFRFKDAKAYSGRILPVMLQSGGIMPSMKQSGRVQPVMLQSGRILPTMRQRGRMLPGLEQGARILPK